MNLTALQTELIARGAEGSDSARLITWINLAYHEIVNAYDWPFTEVEATGTANAGFVAVTDFRKAQFVTNKAVGTTPGAPLNKILYPELIEDLGVQDIASTGTPSYWWYDGVTSRINTFPVGGTVFTRYQKRPVDLAVGADVPIIPTEYQYLIVDRAMVEAYKDNDEFSSAGQAYGLYKVQLLQMARDIGVLSRAPGYVQVSDPQDG